MNLAHADFPRIRGSLAAALAMTAIGIGAAWVSTGELADARRRHAEAEQLHVEFTGKLLRVRDEETEIRRKTAQFNELRARGIIGDEQRLEWIELMRQVRGTRRLLDLQYEFSPQQAVDRSAPDGEGFRRSPMKLRMKLLHEGDLLDFIADLRAHARAYIRVRRCSVSRIGGTVSGDTAQLGAACELDWITIRAPQEGK